MKRIAQTIYLLLLSMAVQAQPICNPAGNILIYSNYDGGILNIQVDVNIPNLKVGICTYEAVQVNFSGPFVGNITEVAYAGFGGTNDNCGSGVTSTSINGVPPGIVSIYSNATGNTAISPFLGEPLLPGFPPLVNCMVGASECTSSTDGGGNTSEQIVQFFLAEFGPGATLYAHETGYNCFSGTYTVSSGGNCCLQTPTTPPNPIFQGGSNYNFIPDTVSLCDGPVTFDLSFYPVLFQPPIYPGYTWSNGATGPVVTFNTPGTYSFTVGDYCQELTDTVVVLECCTAILPDPLVAGSGSYCPDETILLTAIPQSGGDIAWYANPDGTNLLGTGPEYSPNLTAPGEYTFYAVEDDGACESEPAGVTVTILPSPEPIITAPASQICEGQTLTLGSSFPSGNLWSTGQTTVTIEAGTAGAYTVTVVDANGCSGTSDPFQVTVLPIPTAAIAGDGKICPDETATLVASGQGSYLWSTGETADSITVAPAATETYWLAVTENGCSDTAFWEVIVGAPPFVELGADQVIQFGESVTLSAAGNGISFQWSPVIGLSCTDCPQSQASPPSTTTYIVVVADAAGCISQDQVTVEVRFDACRKIFLPNVFTPDFDGINDEFCPYGGPCVNFEEMLIFDRWGGMVFQSQGPDLCWDGLTGGKRAAQGVYGYQVRGVFQDGQPFVLKGDISLLR